jgi:hypothetical protein
MVPRLNKVLTIGTASILLAAPSYAQQPSSSNRVSADPNERICEDIIAVGSRLATKRICATRAEWEAQKKADRDVIEDAQRHANDPCNTINTHSGGIAC